MTDHQRYRITMWFAAAVIICASVLLATPPTLAQNATEEPGATPSTATANNKKEKQVRHTPTVTVQSVQAIPLEDTAAQQALKPKDQSWWQSKLPKAGQPPAAPRRHAADKAASE